MIKAIAAFFERRRLRQLRIKAELAAASVSLAAFKASADELANPQRAYVTWSDDTRFIVQVCHGTTRPPQRAWFSVTRDGLIVTPITYEQVNAVYRVPTWR